MANNKPAQQGRLIERDFIPEQAERPANIEAEQCFLGALMASPDQIEHYKHLRAEVFFDLRHALIWKVLRWLYLERKPINEVSLCEQLKKDKVLEQCGGLAYVSSLPDKAPPAATHTYYSQIIQEKFSQRRLIDFCTEIPRRVAEFSGDYSDLMMGIRADIEAATTFRAADDRPPLKIWDLDQLKKYEIPEHLRLVGDNEINMGYDGLALIAGPGSSGKSLAAASLALAGAIGSGTWMGRKVHRQFTTLFLQAENGVTRIKREMETMKRLHPKVDIENRIFISEPPEGGLPFHRAEFRAAVRRMVENLKPALVVLDPWSQIAVEDSSKDIVETLAQIRSCYPAGDDCPGTLIIAHTKKPRPEDVRRGRSLTYAVSGSIALPNSARCVYLLLPFTDELEDERIYWACPKINNGENYPATVWKRRFGTFFEHDPATDPKTWGIEIKEVEESRVIEPEDLVNAFGSEHILKKSALARRLSDQLKVGESTAYRAITRGKFGYLASLIEVRPDGCVKLKANGK